MKKTYKYRLYPSAEQVKTLERWLDTCRNLYNNSLAERLLYSYKVYIIGKLKWKKKYYLM